MIATSASAMYVVGAPAGEWSPSKGVEMTEISGGWQWKGLIGETEYYCFATDLADDWQTFNSQYRLAPTVQNLQAFPGDYSLVLGEDRSFRGCGMECTYTVTKVDDSFKLTITTESEEGDIPEEPMYIIGEPAGDWSPSVGLEMARVPGGWKWTSAVGRDTYFGFATQLEEPGSVDWDHFNSTYRLCPEVNGTYALPGDFELYCNGSSAAFRGCDAECTYFIKKDGDNYTLTVTALQKVPSDLLIETMGVIGSFNGWAGDVEMTDIATNIWVAIMDELDGDFKFRANGSWDINYGCGSIASVTSYDSVEVVEDGGNFMAEGLKDVTLILDIPNMKLYTTSNGTRPSSLAVRGEMNNWAWQVSECLFTSSEPGIYTVTLPNIEAGTIFKISNQDWLEQYTTCVTDMVANYQYPLVPDSWDNMAFAKSYSNITLILDTNNNTLSATVAGEGSGITEISSTDQDTIYYNLQGAKVGKDTKGILIRVSNGKAEKLIVK